MRIILASGSQARQKMLQNAGVSFSVYPANIDEQKIIQYIGNKKNAAEILAKEKAVSVSIQHKDALVIGSDQVLEYDGKLFSKAPDRKESIEKLKILQGQTHRLISSVCVAQNGAALWSKSDHADMAMHGLTDDFIARYADVAGDVLTACVGAYAYEAHGAWLFKKSAGDYFTILGMPLLPLLQYLRIEHGVIP